MELKRFLYLMKCSFRICFIAVTNLYCIPTYLFWMWFFLLPFRILNYPAYWYVEGVVYRWLLNVVASWSWGANYQIYELGHDIDSCIHDRCLFLVNHQSTADVPFLMLAFSEKSTALQSVMWIMDRLFRYTNFGVVSVTHGDYFITQGKNVRDYQMKKLRDHLLNNFIGRNRRWIILFPEGGFLSKRKETSVNYAKKNNFPILERVTLPRVGAMNIILETLRDEKIKEALENEEVSLLTGTEEERAPLKWVIDTTIAYPEPQKPLDLLAICAASRPPCRTYVHYHRYPIEELPSDSMESLRDWVYLRWAEKEELLEEYYSTGKFPLLPKSQRINKKSKGNEESIDSEKRTDNEEIIDNEESIDSKKRTDNEESTDNEEETCNKECIDNKKRTDSEENTHLQKPRVVRMSEWWIVFLHFFFISSSLFHCYLFCKMWNFFHT